MSNKTTETCDLCGGKKEVFAFAANGLDQLIICPRCNGSGVMKLRNPDWVVRGICMRRARIAARVGLRERAKQLGILPSEYTDMEHGRIEPADRFHLKNKQGET